MALKKASILKHVKFCTTRRLFDNFIRFCLEGMQSGIKLYIEEIVEILTLALSSQSWKLKSQAARAIKTIADSLGMEIFFGTNFFMPEMIF